jgi:hypothetical protein
MLECTIFDCLEKHTMSCGLNILRYYWFVFHDFQFACIELTLMTQGIQMVWHQFEDVDMKEQL